MTSQKTLGQAHITNEGSVKGTYVTPDVVTFGGIADLTAGGSQSFTEGDRFQKGTRPA